MNIIKIICIVFAIMQTSPAQLIASEIQTPVLKCTLHIYNNLVTTAEKYGIIEQKSDEPDDQYTHRFNAALTEFNNAFGYKAITPSTPVVTVWAQEEGKEENLVTNIHETFGPKTFHAQIGYYHKCFPFLFPLHLVRQLKENKKLQLTIWDKPVELTAGDNGPDSFDTVFNRVTLNWLSTQQ